MIQENTSDIKHYFINALDKEDFVMDRSGQKTIELIGASFFADQPAIFGTPNESYIEIEKAWYESQSTNVNWIPETYNRNVPEAWKASANQFGEINSNYGHLIYSDKYHHQYGQVLDELLANPDGRRASMIYTRPSIWMEYNEDGKNDFICTNAVTYYIRDNCLHNVVQMRSNDVVFGYKNDYAWQLYVLEQMVKDYNDCKSEGTPELKVGDIVWQVQNLHVYERHFHLVK
jgi:thymidylate synthase